MEFFSYLSTNVCNNLFVFTSDPCTQGIGPILTHLFIEKLWPWYVKKNNWKSRSTCWFLGQTLQWTTHLERSKVIFIRSRGIPSTEQLSFGVFRVFAVFGFKQFVLFSFKMLNAITKINSSLLCTYIKFDKNSHFFKWAKSGSVDRAPIDPLHGILFAWSTYKSLVSGNLSCFSSKCRMQWQEKDKWYKFMCLNLVKTMYHFFEWAKCGWVKERSPPPPPRLASWSTSLFGGFFKINIFDQLWKQRIDKTARFLIPVLWRVWHLHKQRFWVQQERWKREKHNWSLDKSLCIIDNTTATYYFYTRFFFY